MAARVTSGLALPPHLPRTMIRLLRRLYGGAPERGGRILEGVQPDLLAEQLVAAALARAEALIAAVFDRDDPVGNRHGLTVLNRLVQRRLPRARGWLEVALRDRLEMLAEIALAVAVETGDPVGGVLAAWVEAEATPELAERLMDRCDKRDYQLSVPLREVALAATEKCLAVRRAEWPEPEESQRAELARLADHLGIRLSALGRREEALAATAEGVEILRQLAAKKPDAFRPDLANSLNNLASDLSALGRTEEGVAAAEEAVRLLGPFFLRHPAAFRAWMGMMVENYVDYAEAAGKEPDQQLLGPINEHLRGRPSADGET